MEANYAVPAPRAVPGLVEFGHTFCTLDGATRLCAALDDFRTGRILVLTAAPAYKCPAAPYEAAMLIDGMLRQRRQRQAVELEVHSAEAGPMMIAGPEASAAVRSMVEQQGVAYQAEHQVARVDGRRVLFSDGAVRETDLLVYVPPIGPPVALRGLGLVDESGWVRPGPLQPRWFRPRASIEHGIQARRAVPVGGGRDALSSPLA